MRGIPGSGRLRTRSGARGRRLTWPLVLAGLALVVLSGYRLAAPELSAVESPAAGRVLPPPPVVAASTPAPTATPPPMIPPPVVTDPVRLRIPAIAVDAPVIGLGLTAQGAIDVPTKWGDVGWYQAGVAPGAVGPAVLVGHYDSKKGPAVFYRLRSLLPGDQITVVGASGMSVTFVVDRAETVSKSSFPSDRVYGPVARPEIRLITCDGGFDEHTHHYLDNHVVYGHAVPTPVAPPAPAGAAIAPAAAPPAVTSTLAPASAAHLSTTPPPAVPIGGVPAATSTAAVGVGAAASAVPAAGGTAAGGTGRAGTGPAGPPPPPAPAAAAAPAASAATSRPAG